MYKHRLRRRVFEKGQWLTKIVHSNADRSTGILDKDGKEIFEGDKVRCDGEIYTVEFTRGAFRIGDLLLYSCAEDTDITLDIVGE